jgi:hypothetical protein
MFRAPSSRHGRLRPVVQAWVSGFLQRFATVWLTPEPVDLRAVRHAKASIFRFGFSMPMLDIDRQPARERLA